MIRTTTLVLVICALAACTNDPDRVGASRATWRLLVERLGALVGPAETAPFGITRAGIAGYPDPLIVATTDSGNRAGLVFAGRNGPWTSWQTLDGISFTTRAGVLTATRGFGDDLLSAEASGIVDRITARSEGPARRVERRLDGDNKIVIQRYLCAIQDKGAETIVVFEIAHATRRMTENCRAETPNAAVEGFENTYWVGSGGTVWRSEQRVGPRAGRVILEQLIE